MDMKIFNELEKILDYEVGRATVFLEARELIGKTKGIAKKYDDLLKEASSQEKILADLVNKSSGEKEKISAAEKKASDIEEAAKVKALTIVEKAELEAKSKIDAATAEVAKQKAIEVKATADAKAALDNLSGIQTSLKAAEKEWAATQAKFKAVVGG